MTTKKYLFYFFRSFAPPNQMVPYAIALVAYMAARPCSKLEEFPIKGEAQVFWCGEKTPKINQRHATITQREH